MNKMETSVEDTDDLGATSKRKAYTITEKIHIIDRIKKGETQAAVSRDTGIRDSTIRGWLKDEDKLRQSSDGFDDRKRTRLAKDPQLDKAVSTWLSKAQSEGMKISGPDIQAQAKKIFQDMHGEAAEPFYASNGWLRGFKERHSIRQVAIQEEQGSEASENSRCVGATSKDDDSFENLIDQTEEQLRGKLDVLNDPEDLKTNEEHQKIQVQTTGTPDENVSALIETLTREPEHTGLQIVTVTSNNDTKESKAMASDISNTDKSDAQQTYSQSVFGMEDQETGKINDKQPSNQNFPTKQVAEAETSSNSIEPCKLKEPMVGQDDMDILNSESYNVITSFDNKVDSGASYINTTSAFKTGSADIKTYPPDNITDLNESKCTTANTETYTTDNQAKSADLETDNITSMTASIDNKAGPNDNRTSPIDNNDNLSDVLPNNLPRKLAEYSPSKSYNSVLDDRDFQDDSQAEPIQDCTLDNTAGLFDTTRKPEPVFGDNDSTSEIPEEKHLNQEFNNSVVEGESTICQDVYNNACERIKLKEQHLSETIMPHTYSASIHDKEISSNEYSSDVRSKCVVKNGVIRMVEKEKSEVQDNPIENKSAPSEYNSVIDEVDASDQQKLLKETQTNDQLIIPVSIDSDLGLSIVSVRGNVADEDQGGNQNTCVSRNNDLNVGNDAVIYPEITYIDPKDKQSREQDKKKTNLIESNNIDVSDSGEPFMIMDVRTLSDSCITDREDALTDSTSNRTEVNTTVKTSHAISQSIEALKEMCSSVNMIASGSASKHQGEKQVLSTNIMETTPQVTISRVTSQNQGQPDASLPIISNIFSIKSEPQDQGYSHAEGAVSPCEVSYKSVERTCQANITMLPKPSVVCRPPTSVVKVVVTTPGSSNIVKDTNITTSAQVPTLKSTPVIVQVVRGKTAKPSFPRPYFEKGTTSTANSSIMVTKKTSGDCGSRITTIPAVSSEQNVSMGKSDFFDSVNIEPMNIKNVGVSKITELIARKNPIATYKPPPLPDTLKTNITANQQYPCYECGDSFLLEKSLHNHLTRRSMKIKYYCEKCCKNIIFTNKCQMLNHLRGHLNIAKTQAVPIHIKSDSIEISTYFYEIAKTKEFKCFDDLPADIEAENQSREPIVCQCQFCTFKYRTVSERILHYAEKQDILYYCDLCPVYMGNPCGLKAHKNIHNINISRQFNLLVCPECGEDFSHVPGTEKYFFHIKHKCAHLCRFSHFNCKKCAYFCSSVKSIENHLLSNLEMYYKCQMCPMALRSVSNYFTHMRKLHGNLDIKEAKPSMLYRCHYCGTLINDRNFLNVHIKNHINEIKSSTKTKFHCIQCTKVFKKKNHLLDHYSATHKSLPSKFSFCIFCCKNIGTAYEYVIHMLVCHTADAPKIEMKFCDECGEVCSGVEGLRSHRCVMKVKLTGGVLETKVATGNTDTSKPGSVIRKSDESVLRLLLPKPKAENEKSSSDTEIPIPAKETNSSSTTKSKKSNKLQQVPVPKLLPPDLQLPQDVSPVCKSCGENLHGKIHRINHLRTHRENGIFICISCDKMGFQSYHDLRSHEILCISMKAKKPEVMEPKPKAQTARKHTSPKIKIKRQAREEFSVELVPDTRTFTDPLPADIERKCDQCNAVFTRKSKLDEHKKKEHGLHPCHLCGLMHDSQSALKKHLILSHEGKKLRYICFICKRKKIDKHFSEKSKLEKHMRQRHRTKQWEESMVEPQLPGLEGKSASPEPEKRKFDTQSDNGREEVPVKKAKSESECDYKCAKCLFTCKLREDFVKHVKEHKGDLAVQCFECGLCFAVLPSLRKHLFIVHKVRDFDKYCTDNDIAEPKEMVNEAIPDITPDASDLETSEDDMEVDASNPLECQVCYKTFENEAGLKGHMRIHGMALIKKLRRKPQTVTIQDSQKIIQTESAVQEEDGKIQDETNTKEQIEKV